jgi:integrase/recombinase XerD
MAKPASRVSGVVMTGPLAPFEAAYKSRLQERCYTPLTMVNQLRQVTRLSRWLEANGLTAAELTGGRVEEFLAVQRSDGRHRGQRSRPGLLCMLDVLRGLGEVPGAEPTRVGSPLAAFHRYLLSERALATGTPAGMSATPGGSWMRCHLPTSQA